MRSTRSTTRATREEDVLVDAPAVSRRAAVLSLGAVALVAAPFSTARARGVPEFECAGEYVDSPTGLRACDVVVGEGAAPKGNQQIKAHYAGRLEDGRVFDSSYERGTPLQFKASQVIQSGGSDSDSDASEPDEVYWTTPAGAVLAEQYNSHCLPGIYKRIASSGALGLILSAADGKKSTDATLQAPAQSPAPEEEGGDGEEQGDESTVSRNVVAVAGLDNTASTHLVFAGRSAAMRRASCSC